MRRFPVPLVPRVLRSLRSFLPVALLLLLAPALALAAGNGKLQIHHIDVGQGDGILVISPLGETALIDDGTYTDCSGIKSYLQSLGLTTVKYHFTTHYHSDHIGCIDDLAAIGITIGTAGYDRGGSYSSGVYTAYVNTLGAKRTTIAKNQVITMDAGQANPVTIKCVDLNGAGVYSGSDENALSTVYLLSYGAFQEVLGGDLSGASGSNVEAAVGPEVGDVEIYKVHHHGSATSTTTGWLNATTPEVGIISVGDGNSYGHPTSTALTNLHNKSVHTYWTETGAGVSPNPSWDKVGGTIVVQAQPGSGASYTVAGSGFTDTYYNGGGAPPPPSHAQQVATAMTMLKGSITTGDVSRLAADDANRVSVGAGVESGNYVTDWYGSVTLAHPPLNLTVTYDGNYTISRTQYLYLWNFGTSAWVQINSASVGTTDVTKTWSTTSPGSYVSATREVRLRVRGSTRSAGSYTCRGDYLAFDYDYTSGTQAVYMPPESPAPAGDGIALALAPNPAFRSTNLSFTLGREADLRLDVFDLAGRRVATPFAGHAQAGTTRVEWTLRRADGSPVPAGIYFARLEGLGKATVARLVVLGR
ncbi:MAG TPA: T9SS type A sorting domain-containing protein [Terriglobales bacterium]|nr:T9SS type A sorting domain-containing protein [Terriglobales bacterium]